MTKLTKIVGGPLNFVVLMFGTGAVIGKGVEIGFKTIKRKWNSKKLAAESNDKTYVIKIPWINNERVIFDKGDTLKVLEKDGESILIKKNEDSNNTYFVSTDLLKKISDYKD